MRILAICFLLSVLTLTSAFGKESEASYLLLKGYLGKEELKPARAQLKALPKNTQEILIELDSVSGDLNAVLDVASHLYQLKRQQGVQLVVYIDQNALGPAAIFPFLADRLFASFAASWGDVNYGIEMAMPAHLLTSKLEGFLSLQNPHIEILRLLALTMVDPNFTVVEERGRWQLSDGHSSPSARVISRKGDAVVLNQNALQGLGLVENLMSPEAFRQQFQSQVLGPLHVQTPASQETELRAQLAAHISYDPNGPNQVGLIRIDDRTTGITPATWLYVKAALEHYKKSRPIFIILELNTPGGQVYPAQQISDALKDFDTQYDIPIVAFINNWAISAGAMLAYSSRFIATAKDGSMGAAEPVLQGAEGQMVTASEKVNSALRADFSNRAQFFGRDPLLAEAMVDKDPILVWRHGKVVKLEKEEEVRTKGPSPDRVIKAKGKLLTLNAEQLRTYGVADLIVSPIKLESITAAEKDSGKWPGKKMGLFHEPFFDQIPQVTVDSFQSDWKVKALGFLAHPIVSSLLLMGLMVGFYMEMTSPGAALPGSIAVICLILMLLSSYAQEIAGILEILLLCIGLALIAVEVFLLPTWGLLGFVGIVSLLAGVFGLTLPNIKNISFDLDTHTWNAAGQVFIERLGWLCLGLILSLVIIALLWRYFVPHFKPFQRFVLKGEQEAAQGYYAGLNPATLPQPDSQGIVVATLRPAGKVEIGGKLYDAVSDGAFIEEGSAIRVVRLEGSKMVVGPR